MPGGSSVVSCEAMRAQSATGSAGVLAASGGVAATLAMQTSLPQQLRVANVRAAGVQRGRVRAAGAMQLRAATELRVASLRAECGRRSIIFFVGTVSSAAL